MRRSDNPFDTNALEELAELVERTLPESFVAAMNSAGCGHPGASVPKWRELAAVMRRGAELATTMGNSEEQR